MSEKAYRKGIEDAIQAASNPGKFSGRSQEAVDQERIKKEKIGGLVKRLGLVTPDSRQRVYDDIIGEAGGEENLARYGLTVTELQKIKNSER